MKPARTTQTEGRLAGLYLFSGAVWARTVGVIVAVLWALVAFTAMPWYPVSASHKAS